MRQPGLPNSTTNFNTFPFLLCGSPDQQTLRFPQRALWKQINVCVYAQACTRTYIYTHLHTNQSGDTGTTLRQWPFKAVMWNDPFPSANQITSSSWARTHPHLKLEAHVHAAHTHTHTFHTHIILSNQIFLHKPSCFCEHTKSAKTS